MDEAEILATYRRLNFIWKASVIDRAKVLLYYQMDRLEDATSQPPGRVVPLRLVPPAAG